MRRSSGSGCLLYELRAAWFSDGAGRRRSHESGDLDARPDRSFDQTVAAGETRPVATDKSRHPDAYRVLAGDLSEGHRIDGAVPPVSSSPRSPATSRCPDRSPHAGSVQ